MVRAQGKAGSTVLRCVGWRRRARGTMDSLEQAWAALVATIRRATARLQDRGIGAFERGDYSVALAVWRPVADQGNEFAQYNIGWMYDLGLGVQQNDEQAVRW